MSLVTGFNIIGILCFFASTTALAGSIFKKWVSYEYMLENKAKWYKFWGILFGIHNRNDAINYFLVPTDHRKNEKVKDINAPIRGIVWALCGTGLSIVAIFMN